MKSPKHYIQLCKKFYNDLWDLNIENLSRTKAKLVRDSRIIALALRNFREKNTGFQSIALCYLCLMATVPLVAVCFALTNGFGLSHYLNELLQSRFGSSPEMIDMVLGMSDNIINMAKSGLFGLLSALFFIWLIIWLMIRVERVFNDVWHVSKSRNMFVRLGVDTAILVLIPFVIIAFYAGSVMYYTFLDRLVPNGVWHSAGIRSLLSWVIVGVICIFTFSLMYKFIPAANVKYKYALKAALYSGIAFTVLQYVYLETQVFVTGVNAVYGAVASIPLFMLWLRYGWLVVLYGAQFSYSFQKVYTNDIEQI